MTDNSAGPSLGERMTRNGVEYVFQNGIWVPVGDLPGFPPDNAPHRRVDGDELGDWA
ncbi:hypothetical protein [Microbacterium sp. NPDC055357]